MENAQMVQQTVKEVAKENEKIFQAINDTNRNVRDVLTQRTESREETVTVTKSQLPPEWGNENF